MHIGFCFCCFVTTRGATPLKGVPGWDGPRRALVFVPLSRPGLVSRPGFLDDGPLHFVMFNAHWISVLLFCQNMPGHAFFKRVQLDGMGPSVLWILELQ